MNASEEIHFMQRAGEIAMGRKAARGGGSRGHICEVVMQFRFAQPIARSKRKSLAHELVEDEANAALSKFKLFPRVRRHSHKDAGKPIKGTDLSSSFGTQHFTGKADVSMRFELEVNCGATGFELGAGHESHNR